MLFKKISTKLIFIYFWVKTELREFLQSRNLWCLCLDALLKSSSWGSNRAVNPFIKASVISYIFVLRSEYMSVQVPREIKINSFLAFSHMSTKVYCTHKIFLSTSWIHFEYSAYFVYVFLMVFSFWVGGLSIGKIWPSKYRASK